MNDEVKEQQLPSDQEPKEVKGQKPPPGEWINTKISPEVKVYVQQKLGMDKDGVLKTGEDGKPVEVKLTTARENGDYYGKVVLNRDDQIVQAVGKVGTTAVVHDKANLEFVGDKLKWLDEKQRMNGQSVQIHYQGDKAKMYPWNPEKVKDQGDRVSEMAQLKKYAETLPPKERTKFENHLTAALSPQKEVTKPEPAMTQAQEFAEASHRR